MVFVLIGIWLLAEAALTVYGVSPAEVDGWVVGVAARVAAAAIFAGLYG